MPFNPYHKWLGIPPKEQPPNHYRLLGLAHFESDLEVIDAAANRQMAYLQQRATGEHGVRSQELLNEVAAARLCLLNAERKAKYDEGLRQEQDKSEPEAKADLSGESKSEVLQPSPAPIPTSTIPRRLWSVEPWHVAVVVGVAFLIGFGIFVIRSIGPDSTIVVESSTELETESVDTERSVDVETQTAPTISAETMPMENDGAEATEAKHEPHSVENTDSTVTEPEEVIYSVTLSPTSAKLLSMSDKAAIEGTGRDRKIRVENPAEVSSLCIVASSEGYESNWKYLYPQSSEDRDISISLKATERSVEETAKNGFSPGSSTEISIFNGYSLDGWSKRGKENTWSIQNGTIRADGGWAALTYTKSEFSDFILETDFKVIKETDADLTFRAKLRSNGLNGYVMEINGSEHEPTTGSLSGLTNAWKNVIKDGIWAHLKLTARGNHIEVVIDGQKVTDYTDYERKYSSGQIVLRNEWGGNVRFRDMKVRRF